MMKLLSNEIPHRELVDEHLRMDCTVPVFETSKTYFYSRLKGIVSPDWKGLQMVSLDKFEV
jgi:hypothetical protein